MKAIVRTKQIVYLCILSIACTQSFYAQQTKAPYKYGDISKDDFTKTFEVSKDDGAVILTDIGSCDFEGRNDDIVLIHKRYTRILITGTKGLDAATIIIPLFKSNHGEPERISNFKAVTYNLENNEIVKQSIEKSDFIKEKVDDNITNMKYSFPSVKIGSIIEYSYKVTSDYYFNLQPWTFQVNYPTVWSEFTVAIPKFYEFLFLSHGYHPYYINEPPKREARSYFIRVNNNGTGQSELINYQTDATINRWVMKDVPAIKEEPYITTLKNYIARIEFQLSATNFERSGYKDILGNWAKTNTYLMKNEDFGADLDKNDGLIKDELAKITTDNNQVQYAKSIFKYIQQHYKCEGLRGKYLSQPLHKVVKLKQGTTTDINLLLVSMLRHAKFDAKPLLLATRDYGATYSFYPILNRYNCTAAYVEIDNKPYVLDASNNALGFNKLPQEFYNSNVQIISPEKPASLLLNASLAEERSTQMVNYNLVPDHNVKYKATYKNSMGYFESIKTREEYLTKGKAAFESSITDDYTNKLIGNIRLYDFENVDTSITYSLDYNIDLEDVNGNIYFTPLQKFIFKENPFKAANRVYPVELPYKINTKQIVEVAIPKGYIVDEMPKGVKVILDEETNTQFLYQITSDDESVSIFTELKIGETLYLPENYEYIRNFFDAIIKKQKEQIVFKKK